MHCKKVRQQMSLAVGDDLEPAAAEVIQQHVATCPECEKAWEQHRRGFAVLQQSRVALERTKSDSIWPKVAVKIQARQTDARRAEFNGWIAGLAVLAACVLVFVFSQDGTLPSTTRRAPHETLPANMLKLPIARPNQPSQSLWRGQRAPESLLRQSVDQAQPGKDDY